VLNSRGGKLQEVGKDLDKLTNDQGEYPKVRKNRFRERSENRNASGTNKVELIQDWKE